MTTLLMTLIKMLKGEYLFVLTAWYDQQRTLDSAFRIANVKATTTAFTQVIPKMLM